MPEERGIVPILEAPIKAKPRGVGFTGVDDPRRHQFQKGHDPTRHMSGQVNKTAIAFGKQLREMLIEEGLKTTKDLNGTDGKMRIQRVVERIYDEAEIGEAWAVQLIFERVDGKVTQPISPDNDVAVIILRGASMDDL